MAKSLAQTVQAWTNSGATAQANYVSGIQSSTKPIVQAAIASQGAMVANFNQAVQSGRWASKLSAVGDAGIKAAAVAKAANFSNGLTQGQAKYQTAMQTWLPIIDAAAANANAMPSGSLAQNLARANAFATSLYNAKRGL